MAFEGSTEIDNGGGIFPGGNGDASNDNSDLDEEEDSQGDGQVTDDNSDEDGSNSGEQRTEKGTKLDPNPQSAVHQQLANERRMRLQYEKVLSDPEILKQYAKEAGISIAEAKQEIKEEIKEFSPDRFKSREDVAAAFNEMKGTFDKTIAELRKENESLRVRIDKSEGSTRLERVATNMASEISQVREKYPSLDPKSPDYDPELDIEIGSMYKDVDFDEKTGSFRGQYSLLKIADRMMKAAGKASERSSERTKTRVIVKQSGRVVTSSNRTSQEASEGKDPSTVIGQRIAKVFGGRR